VIFVDFAAPHAHARLSDGPEDVHAWIVYLDPYQTLRPCSHDQILPAFNFIGMHTHMDEKTMAVDIARLQRGPWG
jgi:hypothetical protein